MKAPGVQRLIEVSLPLARISEQSAREKSIRHGHISTLHIWWARRPLAAMRAAILAALIPAPDTDEEREKLEDLIAAIVDWDQVKDGNSPDVLRARQMVLDAFGGRPPRLLDPFMGGGSTGLEALRLGCETHAVELNPVAHLIELCTLVYPQKYGQPEQRIIQQGGLAVEAEVNPLAADVRRWGEWVLERARAEIGHLYENPMGDATIVGYLWARTVTCPNPACRAEMPLARQWWLAQTGQRQIALRPVVHHAARQVSFEVVDLGRQKNQSFDPNNGTSSRDHATCLVCSQVADMEYIRAEGAAGRMGGMPLAVIYDQAGAGKGYRPFTEQDEKLFQEVRALLAKVDDDVPDEPLPPVDTLGFRARRYGLTRWSDLFNARQLLALVTFNRQIRAAYGAMLTVKMDAERAKAVSTYLAMAADRLMEYSSSLVRWQAMREAATGTFALNALPIAWNYVEINPIGSASIWTVSLGRIACAIEHVALASDQTAIVQQGTATELSYPDGYFDAIVTDPPYYETVPYSELSDFYYVWLKRSVGFLYPELFHTSLSPKSEEGIVGLPEPPTSSGEDHETGAEAYKRLLTKAFAEACRVLVPSGILVTLFAHHTLASLDVLIDALSEAGFGITAVWPYETEMGARIHQRSQSVTATISSILVVCRKRASGPQSSDYLRVRAQVRACVRESLGDYRSEETVPEHLFAHAIGLVLKIFSQNQPVLKTNGECATVSELLHEAQEEVVDFLLVQEFMNDEVTEG